jgi:capsular polysaccharide biosynthesis protein
MTEQINTRNSGGNDEVVEIDLVEVFHALGSHLAALIITTVLAGAIVFATCYFLITPQYESTSILYVLSKSTSITSLADVQLGASLTTDYVEVVSGRPVLDKVIKNLKLNEDYEKLKKKITVTNPSNTRFIEISVRDPDPKTAKQITDEIASVAASYIAEKMDQDPPTIIQNGYADGEPVSPNTTRNTVVGAILGFLIAAIVIVASHLANDTLMTAEDVEKRIGIQVLGSLPLDDSVSDEQDRKSSKKSKKIA